MELLSMDRLARSKSAARDSDGKFHAHEAPQPAPSSGMPQAVIAGLTASKEAIIPRLAAVP